MTEKKRYDWDLNGIWDFKNNKSDDYIAEYDDKAINGYCVLDK